MHRRWVNNVEVIDCKKKLDIENKDLLFKILELYTSVVSCFEIKVITKIRNCFSFVSVSGN